MNGEIDEMFGHEPGIDAAQPVETVLEAPEPTPEPAPVAEQPTPEPVPTPAPEPVQPQQQPQVPSGFVPVSEVQRLRAELRELRQQPQQEEPVDFIVDPDAYQRQVAQLVQDQVYQARVQLGREVAEQQFGRQVVEESVAWAFDRCEADPAFNMAVRNAPNPIRFAVDAFRKEQALQKLGGADLSELDQFLAWKAAQAQVSAQVQPVAAPVAAVSPQPAATPPRSLASAPSAGGSPAPKPDPAENFVASKFG